MNKWLKYGVLASTLFLFSCQEFLEPKSQSEYVPKLVKSLEELLLGESYMGPGDGSTISILGLFDDDVTMRPKLTGYKEGDEPRLYQVQLAYTWSGDMINSLNGYNIYGIVYNKIVGCNAVLDYLNDVQGSELQKNDVKAQALALRSYFYFHLVNLYGKPYSVDKDALGVPLKLSSELLAGGLPRNTVKEVYDRVVEDLLEAERLFKTLPKAEQVRKNNRMSLPFVQLLLSRVYLYMENWEESLKYAEIVKNDYGYTLLDLNSIPEPEAYPKTGVPYPDYYTWENPEVVFLFDDLYGRVNFPLTRVSIYDDKGNSSSRTVCVVSEDLIKSFRDTDLRKTRYLIWESVKEEEEPVYRVPGSKFEVGQGYNPNIQGGTSWGIAFRLSEAFLNIAEASVMVYKETGSEEYRIKSIDALDQLRAKRFAPEDFKATQVETPDELISVVREERRWELCFENHRWFDLRRYGCPELKHVWYDESGEAIEYTLREKDPGYTLLIPQEAFTQNPSLVQNETRNE